MKWYRRVWSQIRQTAKQQGHLWVTATAIAGGVLGLRILGFLQPVELSALDLFYRLRPLETLDDRIVIVSMDEQDIRQFNWPVCDQILSDLLRILQKAQPRAVGLDIYRDLEVAPGHQALLDTYRDMPNLIGIEQRRDAESSGVKPPILLEQLGQVGFNNVVYDPDRKIRRSVLYWTDSGKTYESFAIRLASLYLEHEGITPDSVGKNPATLRLGNATFPKIFSHDGVYSQVDTGGYQVLANFRGPTGHFRSVAMRDVLAGKVPLNQFRNRIVLIGSTATSLKDFSATPYSAVWHGAPNLMPGVEVQANFISQILAAALEGRTLLKPLPEFAEWVWIALWAGVGVGLSWKLRSPQRTLGAIAAGSILLIGISYGAFLLGWIVPVVPNLLAWVGAGVVVVGYIAHSEEELKRSKEFLHRIINSIPDPVFVKDKQHRWVVLNEAYSRFLGKPVDELVEKSDYDVFPHHEADIFWQQDESVFQSEHEQEHESEFTSADGTTYQIATKRSLHKDSAGNLFLVGVIRDITQRKTVENELRRKTVELTRSNAELRLSQDRLSYLANHDALTGLPNRNLLHERLRQCLERAKHNGLTVAVMFLDLDGFKKINDTLGHAVGDLLLQAVAKRLTGCLRTSDLVARLGGDEFVVLLPSVTAPEDVEIVAKKILVTLAQAFAISGHTLSVTTSIGVGLYPTHTTEPETLLESADTAMYEAKKAGKNRFAFAQVDPAADLSCDHPQSA